MMKNPIIVPMTQQEKSDEIRRIEKAMKYRLSEHGNMDTEILDLPIHEFKQIACGFIDTEAYARALDDADDYMGQGQDIPTELFGNIMQTRENYRLWKKEIRYES